MRTVIYRGSGFDEPRKKAEKLINRHFSVSMPGIDNAKTERQFSRHLESFVLQSVGTSELKSDLAVKFKAVIEKTPEIINSGN